MIKQRNTKTSIGISNWVAILFLAFSGQIAWAVENTWFNTFVNDIISPDPRIISLIVAASAITATLTTFIMGSVSDRVGKRRTFIFSGYILWGLSTALFPLAGFIKTIWLSIFLIVLLDCIMTFFGSTANDAAFNAWVTDITDETNRGTVSGILEIFPLLALVVTTVASGIMIENFGYTLFFLILGAIVILCGIVGGISLKEGKVPKRETTAISFSRQLRDTFSFEPLKKDKKLKWLLVSILIFTLAEQIALPFQIIYFTQTLGFGYDEIGVFLGAMTLLSGLAGIAFGFMVDKIGKPKMMTFSIIISSIGFFLVAFAQNIIFLCIAIFFMALGIVTKIIVSGAWLRDLTPEGEVGAFQGIRMVFRVLLPMIIGPFIGERIITYFGTPITTNGQDGFLPSSLIFIVAGIVTLFAFYPIKKIIKEN